MNRLQFSCFTDFFVRIFKIKPEKRWVSLKSASRRNCKSLKSFVELMSKNTISGCTQINSAVKLGKTDEERDIDVRQCCGAKDFC